MLFWAKFQLPNYCVFDIFLEDAFVIWEKGVYLLSGSDESNLRASTGKDHLLKDWGEISAVSSVYLGY